MPATDPFHLPRTYPAARIERGDAISNLGIVDGVVRDGVFICLAVRGTIWSRVVGKGDIATFDHTLHEADEVVIEKARRVPNS